MTDEAASAAQPGISRRAVIGGGSGLALLAALGADLASPQAALADSAPTTADGVISLARSYLGLTLGQIEPITTAPWNGYGIHDWCMWFVSWCLRGLNYGYKTYADDLDFLPAHSTPQVGDIAVFGAYHVGFVSQVNPIRILDGNRTSTGVAPTTTKVNEGSNFDAPVYRRPAYYGAPPTTSTDEEDMASNNAAIVRNYVYENTQGHVKSALIYPDGLAVILTDHDDVDSAMQAHVSVYGLQPTNPDQSVTYVRDKYGAQLNNAQWAAFWAHYPAPITGAP